MQNASKIQLVIFKLIKDYGKGNEDEWKVKELSRDHKPELPDEMERIVANNGRVERYSSKNIQVIYKSLIIY